jgi:uncharacterized protein YwgA
MRRVLIKLALALKHFGCKSIDNLEDRRLIQNKIYLAQKLGAKYGYPYRWYLRGVYSKDLTEDINEVLNRKDI